MNGNITAEKIISAAAGEIGVKESPAGSESAENMLLDGIITKENLENWEKFLSGDYPCPIEYVRTVLDRYHEKLKG